ncbi:MAG TPA: polyketide antibiotic transporter [Marmoricola sp.]|jgi:ABC-2 type transport system permease protein|nr:polyketide antibiotic transporter [Marmoricola sp.]
MKALTGTGVFVRAFVRRDRWLVLWFTVGITLLYWSQAASVRGLYSSQAEFDRAAASMEHNAAFIAMAGPPRALNTEGGQVTWQASAFGAIAIGLMVMFLVGRHTRAEEESGRDELVRSAAVGRQAPMTAAVLVVLLASAIVGGAVAGSLVAYGLPVAGSLANGVGVALAGLCFGAVALLAAQLTSSTRSMYGITGAVLGVSYVLRAIGDVGDGVLSWFSPIGWYQAMHPFSGERWWPGLLLLALAVLAGGTAYALFDRRDVGSGLWPSRPGPARAPAGLQSALGLAWRLQRTTFAGWALGLFLGGLAYGSIGNDIESLLGDSDYAREVFGAGGIDLVDAFFTTAALMLALLCAGFAIASALRPRSEEDDGRVEPLLATALPRRRWLLGHLAVTLAGTVVITVLTGLGMGLGFLLVTGDAGKVGPFVGATLSLVPGVLLLAGLARLLYGVLPRAASLAWLALLFCFVVMLFGAPLHFPDWLMAVSPFHHLSSYPAAPVDTTALVVVLLLAALLSGLGILGFRRRDVH